MLTILKYIEKIKHDIKLSDDDKFDILEEIKFDLERIKLWKKIKVDYDNC